MGQEILELNLVQRKDIAVRTVGLQSEVSEGLKDKSRGEDLGLESGTMDQESGLDGFRLTKPKSTWTRINRMDFGLGEISRALKLPTLGKRNSRPEVGEGSEADYDKRVVKCGKGGQHDNDFDGISVGVELPRACEPLDRLQPSQIGEGTNSHCVFSYGDTLG